MRKRENNKLVVLLLAIIVVLIILLVVFSMQAKSIQVEGNEQYTDEEIKDYIFENSYEKNILVLWIKTKLGKTEEIPFVEKYDVEILSMNEVQIVIYEKSIVGYIDYMGNYMYFDKDGMVVESSTRKIEGIPRVTGVEFDYILLHEPLPVKDNSVFDMILTITQTLNKYKLEVDRIYLSDNKEITLYKQDVKIYLGTDEDLSEKISELNDLVSKLEGRSGTLDMSVLDTEGEGYILR